MRTGNLLKGIGAALFWACGYLAAAVDASWAVEIANDDSFDSVGRSANKVLRKVVYFVSPDGSDENCGSLQEPFKTLAGAQAKVRRSGKLGVEPLTVFLRKGTYYLDDPLVLRACDSGTTGAPVTWSSYQGEPVVISGGARLTLSWQPYRQGIFQAELPADLEIDQLFINGIRQHMARYPNFNSSIKVYNGYAADAFAPQRAERWVDPVGGFIHAMHKHRWGGYHYRIKSKKSDHTVVYEGGWQNNRQMGMHEQHRFVENIFEELDAPGEWFHDAKVGRIYFFAPKGIDLKTARVEIAQLRHLVELQGNRGAPVRHISLSGLTFRHAGRTFMDTKEPLLRSDWTIYRGGAVLMTGAEDCTIVDCEFDQVGGNAIFVNDYNRRIAVRGAHIHEAGASGICFVGSPAAVRNPLFQYAQTLAYADIDKTPGPKTDNYPADCIVEDSLIHSIGVVEKQAAGVQISMSKGITVRHCSIYDIGRAGINISEGTFGGHRIEFCDVFDTVRETGDHGSFNSWGRDRFWHLQGAPDEQLATLALLDAETTIIRNSRWRCDHGWDVDLDDGSSNYEIYNNLFLKGGLKLREGFHRQVYNNIAINNGLHPHVWYRDSQDVVTANIWMAPYRPALMKHWGKAIDKNLFSSAADRDAFRAQGCDANSKVGDPMFVAPAQGDYRVKPDSPAHAIGFQNFPMDRFGVQKCSLKALARRPKFPEPRVSSVQTKENDTPSVTWRGARLRTLAGEDFSAFGVAQGDGGIHLIEVPPNSAAGRAGLQSGDVIQGVSGRSVKNRAEFLQAISSIPAAEMTQLQIVRSQQAQTLVLPESPAVIDPRRPDGQATPRHER